LRNKNSASGGNLDSFGIKIMENNINKSFWTNMRRDSGELRFLISLLFVVISGAFLWVGYQLIKAGTLGDWKIVSSFKGLTLYVTSVSPGLLVILFATIIFIYGLPKVIKNL
jgi:hypothetical protein